LTVKTKFDFSEFPPTPRQIWMNKIRTFAEVKSILDFFKILAVYVLIFFVSIIPAIIGFAGMYVEETITGRRAHEGNSIFGVLPWLSLITLPLGFGLFIFFTITVVKCNIAYHIKRK
jgi:hypothetical protein